MGSGSIVVAVDDPTAPDVRSLLETHLEFAREVTPPGHVHAMEVDAHVVPSVIFFGARRDGALVGVAALRHLDDSHVELKSMHTAEQARGQGVGRAILDHVLSVASERGYERMSLETGTMEAFQPARSLYASAGFVPCPPFGEYTSNPHSTCMTMMLPVPLRSRLADALGAAMKRGDRLAIGALRSALSTIDNAAAIERAEPSTTTGGPIAGARRGLATTEAPRRLLSEVEITEIVRAEIAERESAADLYTTSGHATRAAKLRAESAVLAHVVGGTGGGSTR